MLLPTTQATTGMCTVIKHLCSISGIQLEARKQSQYTLRVGQCEGENNWWEPKLSGEMGITLLPIWSCSLSYLPICLSLPLCCLCSLQITTPMTGKPAPNITVNIMDKLTCAIGVNCHYSALSKKKRQIKLQRFPVFMSVLECHEPSIMSSIGCTVCP